MRVSLIRGFENGLKRRIIRIPRAASFNCGTIVSKLSEEAEGEGCPAERELRPRLFSVAKICRYGFFVARELIMNNDLCLVCAGIGVFL